MLAGRVPHEPPDGVTVEDLCEAFMAYKDDLLQSGELQQRTFDRYFKTCEFVMKKFGRKRVVVNLKPIDFQKLRQSMSKRWRPVALANEIQIVRSLFKYGIDAEITERPIRFGPGFNKPSARTIRQTRIAGGPRLFTAQARLARLEHWGQRLL